MRSTTFDMIGMSLMAVVVGLTAFGILTWVYFKQAKGSTPPSPERPSAERGREAKEQRAPTPAAR